MDQLLSLQLQEPSLLLDFFQSDLLLAFGEPTPTHIMQGSMSQCLVNGSCQHLLAKSLHSHTANVVFNGYDLVTCHPLHILVMPPGFRMTYLAKPYSHLTLIFDGHLLSGTCDLPSS